MRVVQRRALGNENCMKKIKKLSINRGKWENLTCPFSAFTKKKIKLFFHLSPQWSMTYWKRCRDSYHSHHEVIINNLVIIF